MKHSIFMKSSTQTISNWAKASPWIYPLVAAFILAGTGWWVNSRVESTMKKDIQNDLQTLLNVEVEALKNWFHLQTHSILLLSESKEVKAEVQTLIESTELTANGKVDLEKLKASPSIQKLRDRLNPSLETLEAEGFVITDPTGLVLAAKADFLLGTKILVNRKHVLEKVFQGENVLCTAFHPEIQNNSTEAENAKLKSELEKKSNKPVMAVSAPIRDSSGKIIAMIGMGIDPLMDFSKTLQIGRKGESGETYAFDAEGTMISYSRFEPELRKIGLLPQDIEVRSLLNVKVMDPGANLTLGQKPHEKYQPVLTNMVQRALAIKKKLEDGKQVVKGVDDVDVNGYRDYRGVPVIGAWTWLDEFGFGLCTEIDVDEAYQPLRVLRTTFAALIGLLLVSTIIMLVKTSRVNNLEQKVKQVEKKAKKLGQYIVEEKLGAGGMGEVYKASHAMLRRPTAIKLLKSDITNEESIKRFEREVQLTSQLTHPNTIAVYDYGRDPHGTFYYAMEFLDGLPLDSLVKKHGRLPAERVIYILKQICASLTEAHSVGLIHRDIKPANIILCTRGGMRDFVKVLDFGLVKQQNPSAEDAELTAVNAITGTPLYLSPESIRTPDKADARSDLYAVAAVGYFLVTGKHVFTGESIVDILSKQMTEEPTRPTEKIDEPVDECLEEILLKGLSKKPSDRYQSTKEMQDALSECSISNDWKQEDAEQWWSEHSKGKIKVNVSKPEVEKTDISENQEPDNASFHETIEVDLDTRVWETTEPPLLDPKSNE